MRLIDADELRTYIDGYIERRKLPEHDRIVFEGFKGIIDNAPTVETERPQGEWMYDNILNNWKCSECGETPKTIGYAGTRLFMEQQFKFCNHCGADMRGGRE